MRALITGGAGFIGAHLAAALLRQGARVVLVDDLSRAVPDRDFAALRGDPGVDFVQRDLLAPDAFRGLGTDFDLIFHFAAIVGVASVVRQPYKVLRDNVGLLTNVIDFAAREQRLRRLVFASTSEVYAGSAAQLDLPVPTPEDVPIALPSLREPRTSYLLSKLYGEALCLQSGLPCTIIRPHNIYGPRMGLSHVIPQLLERAFKAPPGGRLTVYSPSHWRAFCYVSDATETIRRLALAEEALGAVFNVGSQADEIAMRDLAERVAGTVGKPLTVEAGPDTPGSPIRRCPDMTRTVEVTGQVPGIGLDEGLRRTFHWYRDHCFADDRMAAS